MRLPERQANVVAGFIGAVSVLVGAVVLYVALSWPEPDPRLRTEGQVAQAVVIRVDDVIVSGRMGVTYRFTAADGRIVEGRDWVNVPHRAERRDVREGATIPIRYLPNDPTVNRVDTGRSATNGLGLIVGGVFSLVGMWLVARSLLRERRRQHTDVIDDRAAGGLAATGPVDDPVRATAGETPTPRAEGTADRRLGNPLQLWLAGALLACALGLLSCSVAAAVQRPDPRLATEGLVTPGTVTHVDNSIVLAGRKRVSYEFPVSDGRVVVGRGWTRDTLQRPLRTGMTLPIRYVPEEPTVNRVDGEDDPANADYSFVFFGLVVTVLLALWFVGSWRRLRLERRLLRDGVATQATVTEVREGRASWHLRYRYEDRFGATHEGQTKIRDERGMSWEVGDTGTILYDPNRPSDSAWLRRTPPALADPVGVSEPST